MSKMGYDWGMKKFLLFGNLTFNPNLILWIDFSAFNDENKPAVEVKIIGDEQSWKLIGADRDAAFAWLARYRNSAAQYVGVNFPNVEFEPLIAFNTKVFNVNEIRWLNNDFSDANGPALEIVTTDGVSHQLRDDDRTSADSYLSLAFSA